MEEKTRVRRGIAMTLLGGMLWGLNGTVSGYLMGAYDVDPLWFACVRELLSCWLFLIPAWAASRSSLHEVVSSPKNLLWIFCVSLSAILSSQVAYMKAIYWTNPATATVIQSLGMLFVLAYVCIAARRPPRKREVLGIVCALAGTYLIATGGRSGQLALPASGVVWGVLLAVSYACLSALPKRAIERFGNFTVNGLAFLMSGLSLVPFARPWEHMPDFDLAGAALFSFCIVLGTFGSYALFLQGAKDAGPVRASLLGTIEPVTATVATVLWLKTSLSGADLLGFALILAMVILTSHVNEN